MIEIKNLTKEFKVDSKVFKAVDDVSFKVEKGSIYGIIGLSGAGKSTLIRCINRLEEPSDGKIYIDGKNIISLNEKELLEQRRSIGMIFQNFNLFFQKTVFENIAYPLKLIGLNKKEIETRVLELLMFVDLEEKKDSYPVELSGGQKQRVAIARALSTKPKILLSDEATSALDPSTTKQILKLIKNSVKEFGTTVIMITHQMEVAKEICDRVALMESGKIIEENTVEEIFRNPKTNLARTFVDNTYDEDIEDNIDCSKFIGKVYRVSYSNSTLDEPILSYCIKKYNIDINIISGKIAQLSNSRVGYMYVEIIGEDVEVFNAVKYFQSNGLIVEVVNE